MSGALAGLLGNLAHEHGDREAQARGLALEEPGFAFGGGPRGALSWRLTGGAEAVQWLMSVNQR